jgi:hypothetical protein
MKKLLSILLIISVSANAQVTLQKQLNLARYLTASADSGYLSGYHFTGVGTSASPIKIDSTHTKVNSSGIMDATTVGAGLITVTNPSAIRFLKINADNTVSTRTAAELLSDIGGLSTTGNGSGLTGLTATQVGLGNVTNESKTTMFTSPTFSGSLNLSGITTPSQFTTDQDDLNPGTNSILRVSSNSNARKITSISGGTAGRILVIENVGATDILLTHDDGTAGTAANRFDLDNHDIFISPKEARTIKYDGTLSRWVLVDQNDHVSAFRRQPFWSWDYMVAGVATANFSTTAVASGTAAYVNELTDHPGYMTITSSTTTNSGSYSYYLASTTLHTFKGGETYECIFQPKVASNTNTTIRMGFMDATTSTDAVDGAYIEIPAGSFAAVGKTANNSTRTTSTTIATLAVNTWYRAEILVNRAASSITFTIYDENGVSLGSQTNSANIPTGAGRAFGTGFIATNVGTTATLLAWLDYQACQLGTNKALNR